MGFFQSLKRAFTATELSRIDVSARQIKVSLRINQARDGARYVTLHTRMGGETSWSQLDSDEFNVFADAVLETRAALRRNI